MSSSSKIDLFIPLHLYFAGDQAVNLNSPRLREACKIQGIEPQELVPKSLNDIREMYKEDHMNREALILATQHYEERREAKVKIVISERERIVEEDKETQRKRTDGIKVNRLFTLTGKVNKGTPLPETLKERQHLREMIVRQQREIDEVLFHVQNGNRVARNLHRERVLKQRAENAHYENNAYSPERIEVITGEEFRRATVGGGNARGASKENGKPMRSYIKPWKKAQNRDGTERRKQQRLVYANEIVRFMDDEKKNKEIEKKKKVNYLSFLRRQKGNYLDHQYVWRQNNLTNETKQTRAVRKFYDDQLAHIEEEEVRIPPPMSQTQNFSVSKHAIAESKKWLKNHKQDLQRSYSQSKAESKKKLKPAEAFLYSSKNRFRPVQEYLESRSTHNPEMMSTMQGSLGSAYLYNARDSSDEEEDSARVEKNNKNKSVSTAWAKSRAEAPLSPQMYQENVYAKDDDYHKMLQLRSDRTSSTADMRATQSGFGSMRSTGMMNTFNGTWKSKQSNMFSSPRVSSGVLRDTQRSFKDDDNQLRSSNGFSTSKSVKFQVNKSDDIEESIRMAKMGVQISRDDEAYQTMYEEMHRERERQEGLKNVESETGRKYINKLYKVERSKANNAMSQYEELKSTLSRHLGPTASNF